MQPPLLKTRVQLRRETEEKLWKELHRFGWRQVVPCWGFLLSPRIGLLEIPKVTRMTALAMQKMH